MVARQRSRSASWSALGSLLSALHYGVFLGENVFFLVALGAAYRVFAKDTPPRPSLATSVYFAAVLSCLGAVLWMMPGQGFGPR